MAPDIVICHLERTCAMPRFCANLGFLFGELPFLDRFDAAARAGFTGVEYASPYDYPAAELRARLNATGLSQVLINSPAGNRVAGERGMACVPGRIAAFRDGVGQALDYAVALDCKFVHLMAGAPPRHSTPPTSLGRRKRPRSPAAGSLSSRSIRVTRPAICCAPKSRVRRSSRRSGVTGLGCSSTSTTARPPKAT